MWPFSTIRRLREERRNAHRLALEAFDCAEVHRRNLVEARALIGELQGQAREWEARMDRAIAMSVQSDHDKEALRRVAGAAAIGLHKKLELARSLFVPEQEELYQQELRKRGWNPQDDEAIGPKWGSEAFMLQSAKAHDPNAI